MESGQSWLDQIRSSPLVIFTTRVSGETLKVQAGWRPWSPSRITVCSAPQARFTDGSTLTSSSRHSPLGGSSGTFPLLCAGVAEAGTGPWETDGVVSCSWAELVLAWMLELAGSLP